jgi:hypothetical protein
MPEPVIFQKYLLFMADFRQPAHLFHENLIKCSVCQNNHNLKRFKMPSKAPYSSFAGIFFAHGVFLYDRS